MLGCTHAPYCVTCLRSHFSEEINGKGNVITLKCPALSCRIKPSTEDLLKVLPKSTYERYDRILLNVYLESLDDFRWCSKKGCGSGGLGSSDSPIMICENSHKTCFTHNEPWHEGYTCREWDEEKDRMKEQGAVDDDETWVELNTKPCPKCSFPIEKNGGCIHMTCKCGHEFCWMCNGTYGRDARRGLYCDHKPGCRRG